MTLAPGDRVRRGRVRSAAAVIIIIAWAASIAGLVQRDIVRSPADRLAELALRVNPGGVFYAIEDSGRRIGWASSTIDTVIDTVTHRSLDTLSLLDEFVADEPGTDGASRRTRRTQVILSRAFALRRFVADVDTSGVTTRVSGTMFGDTGLSVVVQTNGVSSDTQHVHLTSPVLLPSMLPLATILRSPPKRGRRGTYTLFDPSTRATREITMEVLAESLFVVDDSAGMNATTGRFVSSLKDTIRAWKVASTDGSHGPAWLDAQGRVVDGTEFGRLHVFRTAYELSFENWRLDARAAAKNVVSGESEIRTTSPIAAEIAVAPGRRQTLKLRLTAQTLAPFALAGGRQKLEGNVLTITAEDPRALTGPYKLATTPQQRTTFRAELQAEPYLQTRTPAMMRHAIGIVRREPNPLGMVELLVNWVADSVRRTPTYTMPDAINVLQKRTGDSNDHAQLFTALARSIDMPTRIVSGLLYTGGAFYYHAWAEVYLGDWVAVDPTFRQMPADAARVRLMIGGLERQAELTRRLRTMHIEVLDAR